MNKDEIQLNKVIELCEKSCGLVMNKDEIQLELGFIGEAMSCGLVMNKDEIQQHSWAYSQP